MVIGFVSAPLRATVKLPVYVPPRSQIVSPGLIDEGPASAVARSHGLAMLPSPDAAPVGETYQPVVGFVTGVHVGGGASDPSLMPSLMPSPGCVSARASPSCGAS